jgi:transposase
MSQPLVPDDLWEAIETLLPQEPPKPNGGRPRIPDRAALGGIVFVLRTGCPWRLLPQELGCGSGTTCWRRLRDWQAAGVWERLHTRLLNWLGDEAAIDWSRSSVDSVSIRAKRGVNKPAPTQLTAANPARSTTSRWIGTAFRSRCSSQPPTPTTRRSCSRSSTPSRRSLVPGGSQAGPASARPNCTPTRRTTPRPCAEPSDLGASCLGLPARGSTRASGSDGIGGWSSARWPGCSGAAASASAMSAGRTYSKGYST